MEKSVHQQNMPNSKVHIACVLLEIHANHMQTSAYS